MLSYTYSCIGADVLCLFIISFLLMMNIFQHFSRKLKVCTELQIQDLDLEKRALYRASDILCDRGNLTKYLSAQHV